MSRTPLLVFLSAASFAIACNAQVLRVPSQHATIQGALNAAAAGDTILVAAGTYRERLIWPNVDRIKLLSEEGAAATTIDGQQGGRVIQMHGNLGRQTLLEGFTVTGGLLTDFESNGAGISIEVGSPVIRACVVTGNVCAGAGTNRGGGIYVLGFAPWIDRCVIESNTLRTAANSYGAGVACRGRTNIVACTIRNNSIRDARNAVGGGVWFGGAGEVIAHSLVVGNAIHDAFSLYGAGLETAAGGATAIYCTFYANTLGSGTWRGGAGIRTTSPSSFDLLYCIIAKNDGEGLRKEGLGTMWNDYNDVWANVGGDYALCSAGPNSISVDPSFAGPNDPHLLPGSPCIDASPNSVALPNAFLDPDGDPRATDGNLDGVLRVDLGGDEYQPARLTRTGSPRMGSVVTMRTTGPAGSSYALLLGVEARFEAPPYGVLLVGGPVVIAADVVPLTVPLLIPIVHGLEGVRIQLQALVWPSGNTAIGNLSNAVELMLY